MTTAHELLRQAAEEFALRIYEIVRAEVLSEVRAQRVQHVSASSAPRDEEAAASTATGTSNVSPLQRVVAFVERRPGAMQKDIVAELGIGRQTVFKVLAGACVAGTLTKRGGGRTVQYFVGDADAVPSAAAAVTRAPSGAWRAVAEEMVAFVTAHPGCRYGEIQSAVTASAGVLQRALRDAKESGAIRMEGTRIKARYFPAAPVEDRKPHPVVLVSSPPPVHAPLSEADRARAESVLHELDESLVHEMHAIRLGAVLQGIVAQVRWLQERMGSADPVAARLDRAIRRITAVRADKELPFITGLKRGATADWQALARRSWARVEAYDRDAQEVPTDRASRPAVHRVVHAKTSEKAAEQTQSFPSIHRAAESLPFVLVGGIKKNEVLAQIEERYGLSIEWTAAQGANARAVDAFIERVKNGKLGGVVILEGLFGHSQVTPIVHALKAHDVPFAYGDRAGTESLRRAFAELEAMLASRHDS